MGRASKGRGHCGRRNQQGWAEKGGQAGCPWDGHPPVFLAPVAAAPPVFLAPAAAAHALHPSLTEVVLLTGYSQTVGWDKAERFLHPPTCWRAAASFRSEYHSFIWMMRNPSTPAVLSH